MKKIFWILISISLVTSNTCDNNPVDADEVKPGRRDYVWIVDTLNYPYNTLYRIWGSSPNDVWATSVGDWDKSISHFEDEMWLSYGVPGIIVPSAIFGFSRTNVFIGAENGKIWRFDGSSWNTFAELTKDGRNDIVFDNMWGESPNDFFAFGAYADSNGLPNNSVIANYKNNSWTMLNTDGIKGIVEHLYRNKVDGKLYMQVINMGNGEYYDSTLIYEYYNSNYYKLYSSIWTQGLEADISLINNEVYFILGTEIAKRKNNQFETFLRVDNPNFYQRIWGRNSKDIFLFMTDGLVHYNGNNQEYLLHFDKPRTQIFGSALFEKEVFFLVYESTTNLNLIYHGRLTE
jgi:hypothetical protein